jgi:hypothetical protein
MVTATTCSRSFCCKPRYGNLNPRCLLRSPEPSQGLRACRPSPKSSNPCPLSFPEVSHHGEGTERKGGPATGCNCRGSVAHTAASEAMLVLGSVRGQQLLALHAEQTRRTGHAARLWRPIGSSSAAEPLERQGRVETLACFSLLRSNRLPVWVPTGGGGHMQCSRRRVSCSTFHTCVCPPGNEKAHKNAEFP